MGMPIGLVNIHLAAEDHEAADFLQDRPPDVGLEGVQSTERDARLREHCGRDPQGVVAIIPNAKDRVHRVH